MENRQKIVNLTFVAVGALFGYVVLEILLQLSSIYDFEARFAKVDLAIRGFSALCWGLLFLYLYTKDSTQQFTHEVVAELSRVTWPSNKETSWATVVVLIMVAISGMILGMLDIFWGYALQKLL